MILDFLQHTHKEGHDYLPTEHNVEKLLDLGFEGASKGDPAIVVISRLDNTIVGYLLWCRIDIGFDLPGKVCFGFGTYVHPRARGMGVAKQLHFKALEIARQQEYTHVDGGAHNLAGLRLCLASSGEIITAGIRWRTGYEGTN